MKTKIGLMIALLLVLVGCNVNPTATPEVTAATDSPSSSNNAMTTHIDKRSGIAFDYPNGWKIVEPPADDAVIYTYSLASYDITNPSTTNDQSESSLPGGETKIDISFYGADETPDSARRTVQADVDSGMAIIAKQETRTAADGSPAYYYRIQGRLGGTAQVIYTSVNGHTVGIVAYGDGAQFEAVVKSLRAVPH